MSRCAAATPTMRRSTSMCAQCRLVVRCCCDALSGPAAAVTNPCRQSVKFARRQLLKRHAPQHREHVQLDVAPVGVVGALVELALLDRQPPPGEVLTEAQPLRRDRSALVAPLHQIGDELLGIATARPCRHPLPLLLARAGVDSAIDDRRDRPRPDAGENTKITCHRIRSPSTGSFEDASRTTHIPLRTTPSQPSASRPSRSGRQPGRRTVEDLSSQDQPDAGSAPRRRWSPRSRAEASPHGYRGDPSVGLVVLRSETVPVADTPGP